MDAVNDFFVGQSRQPECRDLYGHCGLRKMQENGDIRDKSELDGRFTTLLRLIEPPIRSS